MADMLIFGIKVQVEQKTGGMKMDNLKPVESAAKCKVPAFFIHGLEDELIPMSDTMI